MLVKSAPGLLIIVLSNIGKLCKNDHLRGFYDMIINHLISLNFTNERLISGQTMKKLIHHYIVNIILGPFVSHLQQVKSYIVLI